MFNDAFVIGTAVNDAIVSGKDPGSEALVVRHFGSVTVENAMKAGPLNPKPGVWNWGPADAFVEFGEKRVRDTPISEEAITGAAMGAAMTGLRPVAEIMFSDFFATCWDIVANQIARTRYMTRGQVPLPLVIKCATGGGLRFGAQHSQSVENWAMMIPGLKVVAPSTPEPATIAWAPGVPMP